MKKTVEQCNEQITHFLRSGATAVMMAKVLGRGAQLPDVDVQLGTTNNELAISGINLVASMGEQGLNILETYLTLLAAIVEVKPAMLGYVAIGAGKDPDSDQNFEPSLKTLELLEGWAVMTIAEASDTDIVKATRNRIRAAMQEQMDAAHANKAGI